MWTCRPTLLISHLKRNGSLFNAWGSKPERIKDDAIENYKSIFGRHVGRGWNCSDCFRGNDQ